MNLIASLKLEGFNERVLGDRDIEEICERDEITLMFRDVRTSFYMSLLDRRFIVIPSRLTGLRRRFAIWHEIGHHLMHGGRDAGTQAFFYGLLESKNEAEADAFATVALVPFPALFGFDWLEENPEPFALQLRRKRERLHFLYGL